MNGVKQEMKNCRSHSCGNMVILSRQPSKDWSRHYGKQYGDSLQDVKIKQSYDNQSYSGNTAKVNWMCTSVKHGSLIYNSQDTETTRVYIKFFLHVHRRTSFSHKNVQSHCGNNPKSSRGVGVTESELQGSVQCLGTQLHLSLKQTMTLSVLCLLGLRK